MNFIRLNTMFVHPVRFLIVAFVCTLIFFSSAFPASAGGSAKTSPSEGEVNLNKIQQKTDEITYDPPMTIKEIQKNSEGGLNEVQGAADAGKMINPDNAQATSPLDALKDAAKNFKK